MNKQLAEWFVHALTGNTNSVMNWRCIHDQRKDLPAHNYRGTIADLWPTLADYNVRGHGIFCNVNAMKEIGQGERLTLDHVEFIRSHIIDLDSVTATADFQRATAAGASFVVHTSPGKYHVYFRVQPYVGNEFYTLQQRKFAQLYNGDPKVIDATRIIRMPGFLHQKGAPHLVTAEILPNFAHYWSSDEIGAMLAPVNVFDYTSTRSPLGAPDMTAPSLDWLKFAFTLVDPNDLERGEWLSLSAALKQAGWTLATEQQLFDIWSEWCARYKDNDPGENLKLWDSIIDTEVGWKSIERRTTVRAYIEFGHKHPPAPKAGAQGAQNPTEAQDIGAARTIPNPAPAAGMTIPQSAGKTAADTTGEILSEYECKEWFKDCFFVEQSGKIFNRGRFMNATQFNGRYGGKQFIITSTGKITDEAWKAATRSTCWTIPKVDHIRFLPDRPPFEILEDELGRPGLNTYLPARIKAVAGDVSPFLNWFDRILPDKNDQRILFEYMAHCVKFPGFKIPWAPMLQSAEGIGKTIFKEVMQYSLGIMYVYNPKAPELIKSGSTFNAWMRGRLMIMVDEIKIDERRELIEILKPMVTDARIEIQGKGVDQDMEDNVANWFFFSNYKDAIPINKNGRRFPIFYSALQSAEDILAAGMNEEYFKNLWIWLREGGGLSAISHWFLNYPIERGALPVRAPKTSSHAEALSISRSPMESIIVDCVADGITGFRGGYVSTMAVIARAKTAGIRAPTVRTVQTCLENMGYVALGRALRPYMQEDPNNRSEIYGTISTLTAQGYGRAQGYE